MAVIILKTRQPQGTVTTGGGGFVTHNPACNPDIVQCRYMVHHTIHTIQCHIAILLKFPTCLWMTPRYSYFILFFSPLTIVPVGRPAHVTDVDQPFHHVPPQQSSTECSIRGDSIRSIHCYQYAGHCYSCRRYYTVEAQHYPKQQISPLINGTRGHHSSSIPVL